MRLLTACALLLYAGAAVAQQKPKPAFEVAAVRPADPNLAGSIFVDMAADPSVVRYGNVSLRDAIRGAYRARDFLIVAPDWLSTAKFQIEGKMPEGASSDQAPEMLQSLLEERFKLKVRREMKEMDVYALLPAAGGFKMKPSELKIDGKTPTAMGTDGKPRLPVSFGSFGDAVMVSAPGASMLTFVGVTSRFTARPLVDATGIDGTYDFQIRFAPETDAGFLPGQTRMPQEMLIVEQMEKIPTEN
jgi:uncharacterized protein (TIGR03435 family)